MPSSYETSVWTSPFSSRRSSRLIPIRLEALPIWKRCLISLHLRQHQATISSHRRIPRSRHMMTMMRRNRPLRLPGQLHLCRSTQKHLDRRDPRQKAARGSFKSRTLHSLGGGELQSLGRTRWPSRTKAHCGRMRHMWSHWLYWTISRACMHGSCPARIKAFREVPKSVYCASLASHAPCFRYACGRAQAVLV